MGFHMGSTKMLTKRDVKTLSLACYWDWGSKGN